MIVLDANLLLYAYDSESPHHARARNWFEESLAQEVLIGLPWQTIWAFLRISTSRAIALPYSIEEAVEVVDKWLDQPNIHLLTPGDSYWQLLKDVLHDSQVRGPMVTDAQLAALAIEHGAVLYSTDRDFSRFPGLRWTNPLANY